ncbi:HDOD domain-containing protein [Massilia endophytica]|uniref:HDOD domain-containing protein n=1 Tax=Massilia endophytica TaxID=2899220 RepID=UPI001E33B338|nr:HDOD domain-containing protein [Massilia endophytica]UGQ45940.1 HDOD domain-containing protein [Massilia endophytica]
MHQPDHDIRNRLLIARLPAMPQILIKLIELLQTDEAGMPELAALIGQDAGMASKILGVANSSAYHRAGRQVSLEQSLVSLGTDMIKTLVISESVYQTFSSFPHSASTDLRGFWKQSLAAAVVARDVARLMDYPQPEEAYLAGLLHNVGRLALLATAPKEYAANFLAKDDEALCAVEQRTLQITHTEAGAWLVERWRLDSFLADSVLYHHEPVERLSSAHPLIRLVRLAHLLVCHEDEEEAVEEAAVLCGLEPAALAGVLKAAARQVQQSADYLGIDLTGVDDIVAPPAALPAPVDPVQQRLQQEVRDMVLVSEMGQTFARQEGDSAMLDAMTRSARILFDFDSALLLLESPTGQGLVGAGGSEQPQRLAEFSLPLDQGGAVAQAAAERQLTLAQREGGALTLAEEQLFRMLGSEAMVCLPLTASQRCLGVLVGGVAAWQLPACQQRARFLQAFGHQAGGALETALSERGHARRQLAQVADEYREASRRLLHEVNNPLSIIKNYLSVLDNKLARREPVVGELSVLHEEIDRVGQLIQGMAETPAAEGARGAHVGKVVDEVLRLFRSTAFVPASVQLLVRMQDEHHDVEGDPDMLKQILLNLLKNAIEALPEGGRIEVAHKGLVNRERRLYVELAVSDNGPGLPPAVLANLFAPVASSKGGTHRGLGLSIVHSLVHKLGGAIACRSGKGGTSFELLLPARSANPAGGAPRLLDSVQGQS